MSGMLGHAHSPLAMNSMLFSGAGPVDRCVVPMLARVIPAHAVIRPGHVLVANRQCHLGRKGMGIERPYLVVGVQAGKGSDSDMHDVRYLGGAAFACDVKDDWYDFRAEHGRYQRCLRTQSAASSASEDCHNSPILLLICSIIEVIYDTSFLRPWVQAYVQSSQH